jgi:hypothetical protein
MPALLGFSLQKQVGAQPGSARTAVAVGRLVDHRTITQINGESYHRKAARHSAR